MTARRHRRYSTEFKIQLVQAYLDGEGSVRKIATRRDRIRAQLADLKMPGALEAIDDVLTRVDGGGVTASEEARHLC